MNEAREEKQKGREIVTQEHYEIMRKIMAAAHQLMSDAEGGIKVLTVELAAGMDKVGRERANTIADSTVAFLLGQCDELRDFVTRTVREVAPDMLPTGEIPAARDDYAKKLAVMPVKIEEATKTMETPSVRVIKLEGVGKELESILRAVFKDVPVEGGAE